MKILLFVVLFILTLPFGVAALENHDDGIHP